MSDHDPYSDLHLWRWRRHAQSASAVPIVTRRICFRVREGLNSRSRLLSREPRNLFVQERP
jgi:hypothetical protein